MAPTPRIVLHSLLAASLAIAAGCEQPDRSVIGCPGPSLPTRPVSGEAMPQTVDLSQLAIDNPAVARRLRALDEFANSIAAPHWHRRPYSAFPVAAGESAPSPVYHAEWASFASPQGRNPVNYHGPLECQSISLTTIVDPDDRLAVVGMASHARWKPANGGWAASVLYRTFGELPNPITGRPDEGFELRLTHYPASPDEPRHPTITVDREMNADYQSSYSVDDVIYQVRVVTWDAQRSAALKAQQADEAIDKILASPESLRDHALAIVDRLAEKVEAEFKSGTAIGGAVEARMPEHGEEPAALLSDRELSARERQLLWQQARDDIEARRTAIRDHYREMHRAARRAFRY